MARLNVVTEGQSEESFVRVVLAPYLGRFDIFAVARSVETSRKHATIVRGGLKTYEKAKRDIVRWLAQDKSAYVSTLFDLNIRGECEHFNDWIGRLLALPPSAQSESAH